jgi:hypothetical protein
MDTQSMNDRQNLYMDQARETATQGQEKFAQFIQATLAADPLDETCRGLTVDAFGNVTGLKIGILKTPGALYGLRRVHVRGTQECQGNAVAFVSVVDQDGIAESSSAIRKLWPYPAFNGPDSPVGDGNGKGEFEISSKFPETAEYGPLAFGVYDPHGVLISDVCFGWGQPEYKPHVGGFLVFQGLATVPVPDPQPDPVPDSTALTRIAVALEKLVKPLKD